MRWASSQSLRMTLVSAATRYVDNTVLAESRYGYRIRARNVSGLSQRSMSCQCRHAERADADSHSDGHSYRHAHPHSHEHTDSHYGII